MADPPPHPQSSNPASQGGVQFHDEAHINGPVVGGNVTLNILPAPVIPTAHEIPAPPDDFVGRATECSGLIETLITQAGRGGAVALIHGLGGVGKTALAGRVAYLLRGAFPRRVRLDLAGAGTGAASAEAALGSAIRALGYDPQLPLPDSSEERQHLYLSLAATEPTLILADNAAGMAQVKPLRPPPGSALLVTSRQRFALPGANGPADVDLAGLPQADAATLLRTICPRLDDQAAADLAKLCGCLPLALRISAGLLKDPLQSIPRYLTKLAATRLQALRDPQNPDDPDSNVAASFTLSYAALDPAAQSTLAQLSLFLAPFDEAAAIAVVALPSDSASLEDALALLRYRSLLDGLRDQNDTARYSLHDLVRAFAATHLPDPDPAALRHAQHYATVARQAQRLYRTKGRTAEGLALFDRERLHIDTGWVWARAHADSDPTASLLLDYANATAYIGHLRYHQRTERIPQLEVALTAARRLGRRDAEGWFLGNLGIAYRNLGEVRRAIGLYEQVLTIMREIGDRRGEGTALGNLGSAYADLGEVQRAIGLNEQVLTIMREIGNRAGEGTALGNLGIAYYQLGEVRRAIGFYEQRLEIAREIGDWGGEGSALGNLGSAYFQLGEVRRAIGLYEQQLVITREIGDRAGEGAALGNLGIAYAQSGEARRAIGLYKQQLEIAREIGDRRGEGNVLDNLGSAYADLGEVDRAIGLYEQALTIRREIGDRRGEGRVLGNLGSAYRNLGEVRRAIGLYEQQLVITREIGDRAGEGNALGNLGIAYKNLGEVRRAIGYYEQALVVSREIGDRRGEGRALGNLGLAYKDLGELGRAVPYYEQQIVITRAIGDRQGEANASWNLGVLRALQGDLAQAADLLQIMVDYERELGHPDAEPDAAQVAALRAQLAAEQ